MALNNNNISSIDDNDEDYKSFSAYLEEDTNRKKNKFVAVIEESGNQFLKEIEIKNKRKDLKKKISISYIIENSSYDIDELITYSLEDVQKIYNEIREKRKPLIIKILHFIFNVE
jgi:hypothetical protein